jgi:hypothetical protein
MLSKPAQELRAQRYADYEGHKGAWTLTMLVKSYFVPTRPVSDWSEAEFYQDVSKPDVQTEIRKQLSAIEKEVPAH